LARRGYWGDIVVSPYITFGVECTQQRFFNKTNNTLTAVSQSLSQSLTESVCESLCGAVTRRAVSVFNGDSCVSLAAACVLTNLRFHVKCL